MHFDAVIFDLDGTLVDTERLIFDAGVAALGAFGTRFTRAHYARVVGTDMPTCHRLMCEMFPDLDMERVSEVWEDRIRAAYQTDITLTEGALAVLQDLQARDVAVAIATSSGRAGAAHKLQVTGLARFFDVVVTADDVQRRKPAPDPYLLAAARLGVDPARCLAFEDSAPGARAALAAGMTTVLVPGMSQTGDVAVHHRATGLADGLRRAGFVPAPA